MEFSEIMEFYPRHNQSVYEDLKKACRDGRIIPFVGAGLSVFCGYKGWPDVLKELAKFVYKPSIRANIKKMIKAGQLLQAAQEIQNNYPGILTELAKLVDYNKIKNCDHDKLYASAAYVLPYLFDRNPVMTTNFDRVLEEVYKRHHKEFGNVITPYEPDLLTQCRQNNSHCLFKLHGDIGPEIHDIDRLVFTQTQYDEAYADNSPIMLELPQWFQNKKLLFLGCSLEKDRTMDVLAMCRNPGLNHYAILKCLRKDIPQRCIEMGKLGISAIFYPDKKHEAVRIILERLLEDINHPAYEELCSYSKKTAAEPNAQNRFMYNANYISFVGRQQEFEQLQAFCQSTEKISWWAVTGPGGMGKSRLVYEFTNAKQAKGWKVRWLKHSDYSNLKNLEPPVDPCIIVMDDVQAHIQAIGEWFISISERHRSEKLRILLLERDGKDLKSANWADLLRSESPYDTTIPSKCHSSDFLNLNPMADDELKAMMLDFANVSGKPLADSDHAERLLGALKKIDGNLQRPIYALAITDAWCSGKDPTHWSKEQVLDALVNRELKFYYERLCSLPPNENLNEVKPELENLLAKSCTVPFLPLKEISDKEYPKLCKKAEKGYLTFPDLLRKIGIVHKKDSIEAIVLDCPDLIKEYLVLRKTLNENRLDLLLPEDWYNNFVQLMFLRKILLDYPEQLEGQNPFWTAFCVGKPDGLLISLYVDLLVQIAGRFPQRTIQALDHLKKHHPDGTISLRYCAIGLFKLSREQSLEVCKLGVEKLRELHEEHPTEYFAFVYAKGLFNRSCKQPLEDCELSVEKLRELYEEYRSSEAVAVVYAKGLFNLSCKQPLEDCELSVEKLRELHEEYRPSERVAVLYAKGLFNLSCEQPLENRELSIEKLRELHEEYPSERVAVVYANGWFNLEDGASGDDKLSPLHEE